MKKIFNFLIISILIYCIYLVIFNKNIVYATIMDAIELWVRNLLPVMFPFFVISNILTKYDIINYIPNFIKVKLKRVLNLSDNGIVCFIFAIVSGFPGGSVIINNMYNSNKLSHEEASFLVYVTCFSNPSFILGVVGSFLHSSKYLYLILISHYLPNFIFLFFNKRRFEDVSDNKKEEDIVFYKLFINAISSSINSIILIFGTISIFLIFSTLFFYTFHFSLYNSALIKCIFEITMGIKCITNLSLSLFYKSIIITAVLSFAGLSIHMQILSCLDDIDIDYLKYLQVRIIHVCLSIIIFLILNYLFL